MYIALLHDIVEDTDFTVDDIKRLFGEKIASLVDGLTKLKAAISESDSLQAENFKRIILTLNDDVRVILIKLADRLHNIRTIESMPEYKKDKILSETMYVFVPLAHRLGLYSIKSEMENIWLKTREPKIYNTIVEEIQKETESKCEDMNKFIAPISDALTTVDYKFTILKRTKTPYSIWYKMNRKGIPFDQIYDLSAVRIIFEPKEGEEERVQAWYLYSLITGIYPSKTDRIRDWVTQPKSNGYEALHCTVMSKMGAWIEVQIRSIRMNDIAEKGVAAHWAYKKKDSQQSTENEFEKWLDMVRDVLENPDVNALEFLDKFHDTLLASDIYVFTPKGASKTMPKGATALDFAYYIHTEIGNSAIAAKANHKLVPLSYQLRNGDQIEIITANSQKPEREWLTFLKTARAKNLVLDYLNKDISNNILAGRTKLEEELAKFNIILQNRVLKKLMAAYSTNTKDELYSKIGTGLITLEDLEKNLKKNTQNKNVIFWTLQLFKPSQKDDENLEKEKIVKHTDNVKKIDKKQDYLLEENPIEKTRSYHSAECCYPIPGDNVVGFINDNGDVIVHKKSCPVAIDLASKQGNKIINAKWAKHNVLSSLARVKITGVDRVGILNDLTKVITLMFDINMRKITAENHNGIFEGYFDCYVHSTEDLNTLIDQIYKIKGIESVTRIEINN